MKIDTIVLDLDDTLNCLTMTILGQLGADVLPYQYDRFPTKYGYDIISAWSELTGLPKPSVPDFWELVTEDIWATAPRSQQFWLLEWAATAVGRENVIIATVPTKANGCVSGKYTWIERHLPVWAQRQYSITPRKHLYAHENTLLIDDSDSNVDKFRTYKNRNGKAILLPRPWNTAWGTDPDIALMDGLHSYEYENVQ
jgi:hypothetical protein